MYSPLIRHTIQNANRRMVVVLGSKDKVDFAQAKAVMNRFRAGVMFVIPPD